MGKRLDQFTEQEKAEWWVELADQNYQLQLKKERIENLFQLIPFILIVASLVWFFLKI